MRSTMLKATVIVMKRLPRHTSDSKFLSGFIVPKPGRTESQALLIEVDRTQSLEPCRN